MSLQTTTLSILTGDVRETSGQCFINCHAVRSSAARRSMGYCPQVDPLIEWMTGEETLLFYGRLKGIPSAPLRHMVKQLVARVGLTKHAAKPCGLYSGEALIERACHSVRTDV